MTDQQRERWGNIGMGLGGGSGDNGENEGGVVEKHGQAINGETWAFAFGQKPVWRWAMEMER